MHLWSIIIIKIYPALSVVIGGRDGMDCGRRVWMTCSINKSSITALEDGLRRWGCWAVFFIDIYIYMSNYNIAMHVPPFPMHQERRDWVDGIESVQRR